MSDSAEKLILELRSALAEAKGEIERLKKLIVLGVEGWGHNELAAAQAVAAESCSCGGRRFVDDEGWESPIPGRKVERRIHDGLIPCGFCNEGGWDTPLGLVTPAPSVPSSDQETA